MLRSIGTIAVIGMLTVVSSIPISCASAYCTVKADVIVSTNGLIMMFVNTAAAPSLLGGYDCGAGAGIGVIVSVPVGGGVDGAAAAPPPPALDCVKSILAPCCPPDKG